MNTQELKKLHTKFLEIVTSLVIENDEQKINNMTNRVLEIINDLKDHLNDYIEYNDSGHKRLLFP